MAKWIMYNGRINHEVNNERRMNEGSNEWRRTHDQTQSKHMHFLCVVTHVNWTIKWFFFQCLKGFAQVKQFFQTDHLF